MSHTARRIVGLAGLGLFAMAMVGCVGTYSNTEAFLTTPKTGQLEVDMLKKYGTPHLATNVEDLKVYFYKVRKAKYVLGFGSYSGYDLVVVCRDGQVVETSKTPRPQAFCLLHPTPWAVAD